MFIHVNVAANRNNVKCTNFKFIMHAACKLIELWLLIFVTMLFLFLRWTVLVSFFQLGCVCAFFSSLREICCFAQPSRHTFIQQWKLVENLSPLLLIDFSFKRSMFLVSVDLLCACRPYSGALKFKVIFSWLRRIVCVSVDGVPKCVNKPNQAMSRHTLM